MLFDQARRVAERSLWANGFSSKLSIRWCWAVLLHIKHPAPSFFTLFPNYDIMKYKLKDIALSQMGLPFRSRMEPDADGNVAVIQMRDLTEDKLDYRTLMTVNINDLNERHLVQYKDLICRTRGQNTTATIIDQEPGRAVVAAPLFIIRATSEKLLPEYLYWFINLSSSQAFLHSRATGTAMTVIGKSALDALEIPLPNLETQEQIVALADLLNKEQRLMKNLAEQKEKLVKTIQMRLATESEKP